MSWWKCRTGRLQRFHRTIQTLQPDLALRICARGRVLYELFLSSLHDEAGVHKKEWTVVHQLRLCPRADQTLTIGCCLPLFPYFDNPSNFTCSSRTSASLGYTDHLPTSANKSRTRVQLASRWIGFLLKEVSARHACNDGQSVAPPVTVCGVPET